MKIIFHHPLPLYPEAQSASGIRPVKMLEAFREAGVEVDVVAGYITERKAAINSIKKNVKSGVEYTFVYSESSTMPTTLTEPHHFPTNPFLDFGFFRYCNKNNIPVGLFYRDIYWLFEGYGKGLNPFKSTMARLCYIFDLFNYKLWLKKLYLPSFEMGDYIPIVPKSLLSALPPAHDCRSDITERLASRDVNKPLRIFYVGGVSDHYQMHKLLSVVSRRSDVELTICTRSSEWEMASREYPELTDNINVVHESGDAMQARLAAADVVSLFVKPKTYWEFAAPVKLYEYMGYCKPIIASQGTLAGSIVESYGVGWVLPYEEDALDVLIDKLLIEPATLSVIRGRMRQVAHLHTWKIRAQQVIKDFIQ